MEFEITELTDDVRRVACHGRLDADGSARAELPFTAAVGSVGKHALIDLSAVSFVGSLGIRMLIAVARVLQRKGKRMVLFGAGPSVVEVFETVSLHQLIPVVASEAEARAQVAA